MSRVGVLGRNICNRIWHPYWPQKLDGMPKFDPNFVLEVRMPIWLRLHRKLCEPEFTKVCTSEIGQQVEIWSKRAGLSAELAFYCAKWTGGWWVCQTRWSSFGPSRGTKNLCGLPAPLLRLPSESYNRVTVLLVIRLLYFMKLQLNNWFDRNYGIPKTSTFVVILSFYGLYSHYWKIVQINQYILCE